MYCNFHLLYEAKYITLLDEHVNLIFILYIWPVPKLPGPFEVSIYKISFSRWLYARGGEQGLQIPGW